MQNRRPPTADELLVRLRATPDAYPQKLDLVRESYLVIELAEAAYRSASFLDDRILGPATRGAWLPLGPVLDAARLTADLRPLHFIFHTGHVGSTLVSRLLDETGAVLSLREPLPLRTLAEAWDVLEDAESLLAPARFEDLLEGQLRLWSRGYPTTSCVILKATSSAARLAPAILARGAARAIYLNLRAEPAIVTLLAGSNSAIDLRGHGPGRIRRLRARLGVPLAPLHALSIGELAAMSWLTESLTRREVLARFADRVLALDFDALLADVGGAMRRVLDHFSLPADDSLATRLAASPVLTRYSKAPEHAYGAALRLQVLDDARREHQAEIRKGLGWLANLARLDDSVSSVLDAG